MKKIIALALIIITFFCVLQNLSVVVDSIAWFFGIFLPFLLGGAMAFIFNIPMRKIEASLFPKNHKLDPLRRPFALLITLLLLFGVFGLVMFVVIPELTGTILSLADQIPDALTALETYLNDLSQHWPQVQLYINELNINWSGITEKAVAVLQNLTTLILNSGFNIVGKTVSGLFTFVISFIFSIYLLLQKEKLSRQGKQVIFGLFPEKAADKTLQILTMSQTIFSNFISGQCLEAVILGVLFFIAMSIFKMPYAVLIGVLIAITALIPIVGAFIGCFIGVFLILMVEPWMALKFLILFLVLQQIEGNVIYPKVVGNSVGLPPIWVLMAVTVGGNMFGIIGMLVFIPLCSVAYALFRTFIKGRLEERQIPKEKWDV